jgi:SAM-dependent methyltransferase
MPGLRQLATRLRGFLAPAAPPEGSWATAIAIPSSGTEYRNLPPAAQLVHEAPWFEFDPGMMERDLDAYLAEDLYPIPAAADREGYHGDRHYDYWISGLKDYLLVKRSLRSYGAAESLAAGSVFELGCASGRVLRHFLTHEPGIDLWGADLNQRLVEWIRQFLPSSVRVFQNSMLPTLPLEDNSLSLVYAFSVFTHVDAFELAWLAELRRILKPGGMAYLTVHTEHTWNTMSPNRALYHDILVMKDHISECRVCPELFQSPMPKERMVLSWHTAAVNNAIVFHSTDYLRNAWGRFFEIVDIQQEGHEYQDVVLLRKAQGPAAN